MRSKVSVTEVPGIKIITAILVTVIEHDNKIIL